MAAATELAIVLNPGAGARYDERRIESLRTILGPRGVLFSTGKRDLLEAVTQGARERGVGTVGIIGGDGTVSSVLSALHRAYGTEKLPRVALLRGGSMNTIANAFGVPRKQPEELLRRLLASPSVTIIERACVKVEDRLGFLFSAGTMVGFLRALYEIPHGDRGPIGALKLLAKGSFQAFAGGTLIERIETPLSAVLQIDAETHPLRRYTVLAAGTIDQAGLGFRPFPLAAECRDRLQVFAFHGSIQSLARQLPSIRRGQPVAKGLGFAPLAKRLLIESDGAPIPYALDGDLHEAESTLLVEAGPKLEIRLP
jgi:diacylglycerol kinase family enzyme